MPEGQKRAPDLITDGCEPPCGCWELNSGPLEEQAVLLTMEPSLQPLRLLLEVGRDLFFYPHMPSNFPKCCFCHSTLGKFIRPLLPPPAPDF